MSSNLKHAKRSQRGSHDRIPVGIFYYHAARKAEAKKEKFMAAAISDLLKNKEEE